MVSEQTFVVVGASLAGAKAAEALRSGGFDGRILLIGDDPERPYERPPLSKGFLLGKEPKEKAYVHPENFYAEQNIELRTSTSVTAVHRDRHEVELAGGERIRYDKLLLATGAAPIRPRLPGADLPGVLYLRTMADSVALRAALERGGRVVIVGGGWIGLEVAAAARHYGCAVVLLEPLPAPLYRVLGLELGGFYAQVHRDHGVDVRLGVGAAEFRGTDRVEAVVASDGTVLTADVVVVGVGARPNTALAEAAGLPVENGILVDEFLRTADPDIFAAGDVANAYNPFYGTRIRVEHWANAQDQGSAAAVSMLGRGEPFAKVPYFYSDQYDVGMVYSGLLNPEESYELVYRGSRDSGEFCVFWLKDGVVAAGMNVNVWDVHSDIRALIKSRTPVDPAKLADPGTPIAEAAR
ncbi:FAD-dependent pyridine nucleotide-disulfide oxidoreductase [Acidothermus cellulolyticus 11B]|uniref:FAD-dependent pyridine nucleotide-disulfide oxidoreductase n=1 Tax=Acidothermus cellulolyticus (strain ATCC 43068 / DSM 8971 / 11B) TaxID=351607 RepID=A0LT16_ACIC1|nr:FAD-dependent pyridine nucleotide-disulfide oxidoreductase [Acidothermus cellulolyticus 11B]